MAEFERSGYEARMASQLGQISAKRSIELQRLLGDPPDWRAVPDTWWAEARKEFENELIAALLLIYIAAASSRGVERSAIAQAAQTFAASRASRIAANLITNARQRLQDGLSRLILGAAGRDIRPDEVRQRAQVAIGPARSAAIARTETTQAITQATRDARDVVSVGRDLPLLVWFLGPCAHCTFCPLVAGTDEAVWGRYVSGPPAHVHCCCELQIMPPGTRLISPPPDTHIRAAMEESGVFGF